MTPNNALQRTRAAWLLQPVTGKLSTSGRRRAPLSFEPLGDTKWQNVALAVLAIAIAGVRCASALHPQNLVVWNPAQVPERIVIKIDSVTIYSGLLGTVDSFPMIVIHQTLGFPDGQHVLAVTVPGRSFSKAVPFKVSRTPVNLHVVVNKDDVQVGVTYGPEAYL